MKNIALILLGLALSLASCKPDPSPSPDNNQQQPKQYSYWVVNNDSFSSNNVEAVIGLGRCDLYSKGFINSFQISFNIGMEFPSTGLYPIAKTATQDPLYVHLGFYYGDSTFILSPNQTGYLQASFENNKAQYILQPTWFVNSFNHNDSVLIHGVFNEP